MKRLSKELYECILSVADGSMKYEQLLEWIIMHQR